MWQRKGKSVDSFLRKRGSLHWVCRFLEELLQQSLSSYHNNIDNTLHHSATLIAVVLLLHLIVLFTNWKSELQKHKRVSKFFSSGFVSSSYSFIEKQCKLWPGNWFLSPCVWVLSFSFCHLSAHLKNMWDPLAAIQTIKATFIRYWIHVLDSDYILFFIITNCEACE